MSFEIQIDLFRLKTEWFGRRNRKKRVGTNEAEGAKTS